MGGIFHGPYRDFTPYWYAEIGYTITFTMLVNAFVPVFVQIAVNSIKWLFRTMDSGCLGSAYERKYRTKKTQISQYIELYSGPQYIVHFKYSSIFNVCFVTMMYGVGVPLLFPIAVLNYALFWMLEKHQLAYNYQLPPSLDDRLTKNAVSILKFSPLLFLCNGYWMLTNQ